MRSERPTISFSVRKPSAAMYSRISCAMKRMKLTTCAGSPSNFFLSSGFCVATQNPELRKKFEGDPAHVVNFMRFIAQEMREYMAALGFRTLNEMVGRSDRIEMKRAIEQLKAQGLDYAA